jgi:uncharacterized repeat protein (TIGR03803 family)
MPVWLVSVILILCAGAARAQVDGWSPQGALIRGADGNLYGTTYYGGQHNDGAIFKFNPGAPPTILYSFDGRTGAFPTSALVQGSDGSFYGTTSYGGKFSNGTAFKITSKGIFTSLYSFSAPATNGVNTDGAVPHTVLTAGLDGNFYGASWAGGAYGNGTVFKITPGGTLSSLYSFTAPNASGVNADGCQANDLVLGSDGSFYGTTVEGGAYGLGTVFKITSSGTLTSLYSFAGTSGHVGANPMAGLVQGSDGSLYGTTNTGGGAGDGTIFKITPAGNFTKLTEFYGGSSEGYPQAPLVFGKDGNLYGTTEGGPYWAGTVFKVTPSGILTTLYNFTGGSDGAFPMAALLLNPDGSFYGVTSSLFLDPTRYTGGWGTIFKVTPGGTLTTAYSFTAACDGFLPCPDLVEGRDGNFYGMTYYGGPSNYGTVFKITPGGRRTAIYSFTGGSDGGWPIVDGLTLGKDGNLYGATITGGVNDLGTFFKISSTGTLTVLHSFSTSEPRAPSEAMTEGKDGSFYGISGDAGISYAIKVTPTGQLTTLCTLPDSSFNRLAQGKDGNFYGTKWAGGAGGFGAVFRLTPSGALTTLYSFTGAGDGGSPGAALTLGKDGNFYGTTPEGGANTSGTVFKITPAGTLTTLYQFTGGSAGALPDAALTLGRDGNFYGTTSYGGLNGWGTVFRITPNGTLTTLSSFPAPAGPDAVPTGKPHGIDPAQLVQGRDGSFYVITPYGGVYYWGTMLKITTKGVLTTAYSF